MCMVAMARKIVFHPQLAKYWFFLCISRFLREKMLVDLFWALEKGTKLAHCASNGTTPSSVANQGRELCERQNCFSHKIRQNTAFLPFEFRAHWIFESPYVQKLFANIFLKFFFKKIKISKIQNENLKN